MENDQTSDDQRSMSLQALAERASHTTSDFPTLLTAVGNRVLAAARKQKMGDVLNALRPVSRDAGH